MSFDNTHPTLPIVWLVGGPSSVGKTTVARQLAFRHKMSCLHIDDLRLALQRNQAVAEHDTASTTLGFFECTPDVWSQSTTVLRDAFIKIGRALAPSLEIVILNHLAIDESIVIDGDGLLPELLDSLELQTALGQGQIRIAYVLPDSSEIIRKNLNARGWGEPDVPKSQVDAMVASKFEYGQWLREECMKRGFHIVPPLPYSTLIDRIERTMGVNPS
jgi:2-phosphoglycerate kinase